MNKKGFTLVELVGVITLLGIIALIIFPAVTKTINKSKEQAYKEQVKKLENAGQQYMIEHIDELDDIDTIVYKKLYLSSLLPYVDAENNKIINPKTNEEMTGCVVVSYDSEYSKYKYSYNENCEIPIPDEIYQLMVKTREYYKQRLSTADKINLNGATNLLDDIDGNTNANGALYIDEQGRTALAFVYNNICYTKYFTTDYHQSNDIENCGLKTDFAVNSSYVSYGGTYLDRFEKIINTSDGGYLVIGRTNSKKVNELSGHGENINYDGIIVKYNTRGNVEWEKTFGGTSQDYFHCLLEEENYYTVVGYGASNDGDMEGFIKEGQKYSLFVLQYDKKTGTLVNKKSLFNDTDTYYAGQILKMGNKYYLLASGRYMWENYWASVTYLIEYDENFNQNWIKPYNGRYGTQGRFMINSTQDTLLLGGYDTAHSAYVNSGETILIKKGDSRYAYFMEVDPITGNILGKASLGGNGYTYFNSAVEVEDGYILVGYNYATDNAFANLNKGEMDGFIAKFSKTPNSDGIFPLIWLKTFGGTENESFNKIILNNNRLIVAGYSYSSNYDMQNKSIAGNSYSDGIILEYDLDGNLIMMKALGGSNNDTINDFVLKDGKYILVGDSFSRDGAMQTFNYGNQDAFMMSLDRNFNYSEEFLLYPLLVNNLPELVKNYGTSIPQPSGRDTLKLYTTNDTTVDLKDWCTSANNYDPNGNYKYASCLKPFNDGDIKQLAISEVYLSNTLDVSPMNYNNWLRITVGFGNAGENHGITNFKIKFEGHEATTIEKAVELGYIEPLVISGLIAGGQYFFENSFNIITTGTSGTGNFPIVNILIKPKNIKLEQITYNSLKPANINQADLRVEEFHNFDISLTKSE